jgi:hypothetical protein
MRNAFVALLAVGLCATFAMADATAVQNFYDTKDAGLLGHSAENLSNAGGATQVRFAKARQHFLIMDFDWDAINAFVAANIEPGYIAHYKLRLTTSSDATGLEVAINTIQMDAAGMDWDEGDGPMDYALFNWTTPYAATYVDPDMTNVGGTGPNKWMWGNQFDAGRNDLSTRNLNTMQMGDGASWVRLTQSFMDLQSTLPVAAGIYTYDLNAVYSNARVYTDDQNQSSQPMIEVSFVPEPASMSLLVIGGVVALIRRKK